VAIQRKGVISIRIREMRRYQTKTAGEGGAERKIDNFKILKREVGGAPGDRARSTWCGRKRRRKNFGSGGESAKGSCCGNRRAIKDRGTCRTKERKREKRPCLVKKGHDRPERGGEAAIERYRYLVSCLTFVAGKAPSVQPERLVTRENMHKKRPERFAGEKRSCNRGKPAFIGQVGTKVIERTGRRVTESGPQGVSWKGGIREGCY